MSDTLQSLIAELELRIESEFVPQSKSRNAGDKPTVIWRVWLYKGTSKTPILNCDYQEGIGHYVGFRFNGKTIYEAEREAEIAETGKDSSKMCKRISGPNPVDVIACLAMEAESLNYSTYEEFADSLGYDRDSRKGEAIYRKCIETGLRLRNNLGEADLRRLIEAAADW